MNADQKRCDNRLETGGDVTTRWYHHAVAEHISPNEFYDASGVEDWRLIWGGAYACAHFRTESLRAGAAFVQAISDLADAAQHFPDMDVRPKGVTVRLFSGDIGGLSSADVALAQKISVVARDLGMPSDPTLVQHVQIAIDALDIPRIRPFWAAVLGYVEVGESDVLDPLRRGPPFWIQQMESARPQRNRIHVDVYVPRDQVERRIEAAIEAGGHVVNDVNAPEWWTLADAEGNEVDLAIWD